MQKHVTPMLTALGLLILAAAAHAQTAAPPQAGDSGTAPASIGAPHDCRGFYPPSADDIPASVSTQVGFAITANGDVVVPFIGQTSGRADLDDAAIACARQWQYRPAMRDGHAVPASWRVVIAWVPEAPASPLAQAMRAVRRDAWTCLAASAPAKALPPASSALVELHIAFATNAVEITKPSGIAALDDTAADCVRASSALADAQSARGAVPGVKLRLAVWKNQ